jgi:hypothetical protein
MAFRVFKSKAVEGIPGTGSNSMGTITMAEANHGMGMGVLAATKRMNNTVARSRCTQLAILMVSNALKAHTEQMATHFKGEALGEGRFN